MPVNIEESWKGLLSDEFEKPYFKSIGTFLRQAKSSGKIIYPPGPEIFNAFSQTPVQSVKVVIIGQDLQIKEVTRALDACLLTDAELAMGPDAWEQFEDPFAPWEIADSEMGEGCELPGDDDEADER